MILPCNKCDCYLVTAVVLSVRAPKEGNVTPKVCTRGQRAHSYPGWRHTSTMNSNYLLLGIRVYSNLIVDRRYIL